MRLVGVWTISFSAGVAGVGRERSPLLVPGLLFCEIRLGQKDVQVFFVGVQGKHRGIGDRAFCSRTMKSKDAHCFDDNDCG